MSRKVVFHSRASPGGSGETLRPLGTTHLKIYSTFTKHPTTDPRFCEMELNMRALPRHGAVNEAAFAPRNGSRVVPLVR